MLPMNMLLQTPCQAVCQTEFLRHLFVCLFADHPAGVRHRIFEGLQESIPLDTDIDSKSVTLFFAVAGPPSRGCRSSQSCSISQVFADNCCSAMLSIGAEASPHAPERETSPNGTLLPPLLRAGMPASKMPEIKIVCSHSTQSALSIGMTIDFVGDKVGKRFT
jgi:hypothetical protein